VPRRPDDLTTQRYQVVFDGSKYTIVDTLPGLVIGVSKDERSARERAHVINRTPFVLSHEYKPKPSRKLPRTNAEWQFAKQIARQVLFLPKQKKRFWARVEKTDWRWYWRGPRATHGYPQFSVNQVHILAHRYAYIVTNGAIPDDAEIIRQCGERLCVNPAHMLALSPDERRAMYREEKMKQDAEHR